MFVRSEASQLAELVARVDAGDLRIAVAERRPLAGLAAVHDQAVAGLLAGKTILVPGVGEGERRATTAANPSRAVSLR
jgi:hypothetical protein